MSILHRFIFILIAFILYVVAILYGHAYFFGPPGSIFFNPNRAFERHYSTHREIETKTWNDNAVHRLQILQNAHNTSFQKSGTDPHICGVFITSKRDDTSQYIDLAVGSALAGLRPVERDDIDVRIYFANIQPDIHPAWKSWLDHVIDESFGVSGHVPDDQLRQMVRLEQDGQFAEKARLDYAVAMRRCWTNSSAPYIAIFEDDVLLADGWLVRTIANLEHNSQLMKETDWLDLRLFGSDSSTGWASRDFLGNNTPWISLGVGMLLFVVLIALRSRSQLLNPYLSNVSIFLICCIVTPAFVILFFQAPKGLILPPSPGVHRQNFGCCTQAQVFNSEHVPALATFITDLATNLPHDIAITRFARENHIARYALYPVLVQHLGFRSIINPQRTEEDPIWSVPFEMLNPLRLARDHEKAVKYIYGDEAW